MRTTGRPSYRRARSARLVAVLAVSAVLATACGGDGDDAETAETSSTSSSTTTTSTTTTTEPEEVETTTTTSEPEPSGPTYPLSGVALGDDEAPVRPALVMKISNNDARSRASLIGLEAADIVFEERIEANATRFAAVFHSTIPEEIGPVRSGRTSDVDIVANLNNPIFGYSGSNDGVASQLRQAENNGILRRVTAERGASPFYRNSSFSAPDNLMVGGPEMIEQAPADAPGPEPIFEYGGNVDELGAPSPGVRISARSVATYVWSPDEEGYLRFQGDNSHVTREGVHITPTNVVVLTTTYVPSRIDSSSVDAITIGEGPVVVYSEGYRVEGTWSREFGRDPYTLTTPDGDIIELAPGQTWVSLTPGGTSTELSVEEADRFR